MGSGNVFERLWKQELSIRKLILDGKRDPEEVSRILQAIIASKTDDEPKLANEEMLADANEEMLADWTNFYKEVFGVELDFSGIAIPERRPGFDRLLVVAQGMTPQRLFDKCQELFPSWKYTNSNLDEIVKSDRTAKNGHYAVWVRDRVEADEENKNLSANMLKERGADEITVEERTLYELKFFNETGKHLDTGNRTLCAGSRYSGGFVPFAFWRGDKFDVDWDSAGSHYDALRSRSVVSFAGSALPSRQ